MTRQLDVFGETALKVYFKRTNVNHRFALVAACDEYQKRSGEKGVVIVGAKNLIFYWFIILRSPKRVCIYLTGLGRMYTDFGNAGRMTLLTILKFYISIGVKRFIVENVDDQKILNTLGSETKVEVVNGSGFSPTGFLPKRRAHRELSLGCLSRFGSAKHTDQIEKLAATIPDNFFLTIAGEDMVGKKYKANFSKITEHKSNVEYTGYLESKAEISNFFNSIDVLLYPSKREGLPITLLESAFHHVPFLTTDVPGCRQLASEFNYPMLKPSDFGNWEVVVNAANNLRNKTNISREKIRKYQNEAVVDEFTRILERLFKF